MFVEDVDIGNVLLSSWILVKKSCKHFYSFLFDDYKIKSLHAKLPKTSTYVKTYDGQTN